MKFNNHIRFVGESFLAWLGFLLIPFFTRRHILFLSRWIGDKAFYFCKGIRKVAMSNLDIVYGADVSIDRKTEIIKGSFRTFSLLLLDMFWFGRFTEKRINKWVQYDESFDVYWDNSPAVVVTGHIGNWEVLGQAVSLKGHPLLSVATPLKNAFVDWILVRMRKITGQKVAPREGAIRTIMRVLREGGRAALLMDQNTLPEEGGKFVNFFGLQVPNSNAAETLAVRTDSAIVFVYCVADDDGVYRGYGLPALKAADEGEVTQKLADMMEEVIRKNPDKWLWMYKRWKFIPPGGVQDNYPFYARVLERKET
jgi:KDO2-lipid IV(A) lauroyltransferase